MVRLVDEKKRKRIYPTGYPTTPGYTKVAVNFKEATFKRLLAQAKREDIKFSEAVELTVQYSSYLD